MQKRSKEQDRKLWPTIPISPVGASWVRFRQRMLTISEIYLGFENSASLNEALSLSVLSSFKRRLY